MKNEFKVIADIIEKDKRVLDVGCGDGTLMKFLKDNKNIDCRGMEISKNKVQKCIEKGLTVIEGNAENDLIQFPNKSFDYAILSQTLQAFLNPELVIRGILLTMYDKRNKLSSQVEKEARDYFKEQVYETIVPRNVRLSEAPSHGIPVLIYDKTCPGSKSYFSFTEEFLNQENKYESAA